MDKGLRCQPLMAFITKLPHIFYRLEFVLTDLLMTGNTFTHRHGPMDEFILTHSRVAFIRNTGLLFAGLVSLCKNATRVAVRQKHKHQRDKGHQ